MFVSGKKSVYWYLSSIYCTASLFCRHLRSFFRLSPCMFSVQYAIQPTIDRTPCSDGYVHCVVTLLSIVLE